MARFRNEKAKRRAQAAQIGYSIGEGRKQVLADAPTKIVTINGQQVTVKICPPKCAQDAKLDPFYFQKLNKHRRS